MRSFVNFARAVSVRTGDEERRMERHGDDVAILHKKTRICVWARAGACSHACVCAVCVFGPLMHGLASSFVESQQRTCLRASFACVDKSRVSLY